MNLVFWWAKWNIILKVSYYLKHGEYNLTPNNIAGYDMLYNEGHINKNDGLVVYIKSSLNNNKDITYIGEIKTTRNNFSIETTPVIYNSLLEI